MKENIKYSTWEESPDILKVQDCAGLLKIGINQMYTITRIQGFPALHFGKQIRVPKEALKQWVLEQAVSN